MKYWALIAALLSLAVLCSFSCMVTNSLKNSRKTPLSCGVFYKVDY